MLVKHCYDLYNYVKRYSDDIYLSEVAYQTSYFGICLLKMLTLKEISAYV